MREDEDPFVTKDSGKTANYADGMKRDSPEGKPTFGLIFPKGVPYEEQLITRVAALYARGGLKYGPRNWEQSSTEESLAHHEEAFWRHAVKAYLGVQDGEDHAAAVVWNLNAIELTRRNISRKAREAHNDKSHLMKHLKVRELQHKLTAIRLEGSLLTRAALEEAWQEVYDSIREMIAERDSNPHV